MGSISFAIPNRMSLRYISYFFFPVQLDDAAGLVVEEMEDVAQIGGIVHSAVTSIAQYWQQQEQQEQQQNHQSTQQEASIEDASTEGDDNAEMVEKGESVEKEDTEMKGVEEE